MKAVVIGAGGHARSVIEALRAAGGVEVIACTDPRSELAGTELDGVPVVGTDDQLPELRENGVERAYIGVGGTGDNSLRRTVFERARELGFAVPAAVHPSAVVAASAAIGDGAVILAGAIVGPGASVGVNSIVNSGAIVEHDCRIEDHVHVATGAALGGSVVVAEFAHVGIGATVLQGVEIGTGAVVGAGAVVIRDVEPGAVVAGCPAGPLPGRG